ncbi:MAG: transcription antitermination factor NusB [Ilumatobacteraceae bacterium]
MAKQRRNSPASEDIRSNARERALHLLYEAEVKGVPASEILAAQILDVDDATILIVEGIGNHAKAVDELIAEFSTGWTLARMASLDRNILRIGTFELKERSEVPTAVIINEAVNIAKTFSTDESGKFVNGVLSAIATVVRPDEK